MALVSDSPRLKASQFRWGRIRGVDSAGNWLGQSVGSGVASQELGVIDKNDYTNGSIIGTFVGSKNAAGAALGNPVYDYLSKTDSFGWFMTVEDTTSGLFYLYRSIDEGANWGNNSPTFDNQEPVRELGNYLGTHASDVKTLRDRGICEIDGYLYLIEYNVNTGAPSPPAGYKCVIYNCTLAQMNLGGSSVFQEVYRTDQCRHGHVVRSRVFDGKPYLFIGVGDQQSESATIIIDIDTAGHSGWPANNSSWAIVDSQPGFTCLYGNRGYNSTDFAFMDGSEWVVQACDGYDATQGLWGINRFKFSDPSGTFENVLNFTETKRIDGQSYANESRVTSFMAKFSDGALATTNFRLSAGNPATNDKSALYVYTSAPGSGDDFGKNWKTVGYMLQNSSQNGTDSVDVWEVDFDDRLIASYGFRSGRSSSSLNMTVILDRDGTHSSNDPLYQLDPNFWVDPDIGVDVISDNRGWYPELPYKTLNFALSAGCRGSTIHLPSGNFVLDSNQIDTEGADGPFPDSVFTDIQILGQGDSTVIVESNGTSSNIIYTNVKVSGMAIWGSDKDFPTAGSSNAFQNTASRSLAKELALLAPNNAVITQGGIWVENNSNLETLDVDMALYENTVNDIIGATKVVEGSAGSVPALAGTQQLLTIDVSYPAIEGRYYWWVAYETNAANSTGQFAVDVTGQTETVSNGSGLPATWTQSSQSTLRLPSIYGVYEVVDESSHAMKAFKHSLQSARGLNASPNYKTKGTNPNPVRKAKGPLKGIY